MPMYPMKCIRSVMGSISGRMAIVFLPTGRQGTSFRPRLLRESTSRIRWGRWASFLPAVRQDWLLPRHHKHVPFSRFVVRKSPWLSVARWSDPRFRNWTTWHCHPVCRRSSCRHRNSRPHYNWNRARFSDWSSHRVKSKDHLRLGNGSYAKPKSLSLYPHLWESRLDKLITPPETTK